MARKHGQNGQKTCYVHGFVWECFNGVIPEGKVIDHIYAKGKIIACVIYSTRKL